jgi:hypothetical protein
LINETAEELVRELGLLVKGGKNVVCTLRLLVEDGKIFDQR